MVDTAPCGTPAFFLCQNAGKPRSISKRCFAKAHTTCEVIKTATISGRKLFPSAPPRQIYPRSRKGQGYNKRTLPPQSHYCAPLTRFRLLASRWPKRREWGGVCRIYGWLIIEIDVPSFMYQTMLKRIAPDTNLLAADRSNGLFQHSPIQTL